MKPPEPTFDDVKDRNPGIKTPKDVQRIKELWFNFSQWRLKDLTSYDKTDWSKAVIRMEQNVYGIKQFVEEYGQHFDYSKVDFTETDLKKQLNRSMEFAENFNAEDVPHVDESPDQWLYNESAFNRLDNMIRKIGSRSGLDPTGWMDELLSEDNKPNRHSEMEDGNKGDKGE